MTKQIFPFFILLHKLHRHILPPCVARISAQTQAVHFSNHKLIITIYGGFMARIYGGFMADLWRADLWRIYGGRIYGTRGEYEPMKLMK